MIHGEGGGGGEGGDSSTSAADGSLGIGSLRAKARESTK